MTYKFKFLQLIIAINLITPSTSIGNIWGSAQIIDDGENSKYMKQSAQAEAIRASNKIIPLIPIILPSIVQQPGAAPNAPQLDNQICENHINLGNSSDIENDVTNTTIVINGDIITNNSCQ